MPKSSSFVCQACGASAPKWSGKCEACDGWNTIVEEGAPPVPGAGDVIVMAVLAALAGMQGLKARVRTEAPVVVAVMVCR